MQLLNDGAPAYRARATTAYMNAKNVNFVDVLPKSPDLNIIENIWDKLNHRARRTGAIPTTLNQLRETFSTSGTTYLRITFSVMWLNETP